MCRTKKKNILGLTVRSQYPAVCMSSGITTVDQKEPMQGFFFLFFFQISFDFARHGLSGHMKCKGVQDTHE